MSGHSSFRDLAAWQFAITLVEKAYAVSATLPQSERFELGAQIRRAAVSVPSYVAEGQRRSPAEFRQQLRIALGSLAELKTQLKIVKRLKLGEPAQDVWAVSLVANNCCTDCCGPSGLTRRSRSGPPSVR